MADGAGDRRDAERSLRDHQALVEAVTAVDPGPEQVLAALSLLSGVRLELDQIERRLIQSARGQGTSWARLSAALGLASRQAAEQRWLRLRGASSRDPARVRAARRQRAIGRSDGGPLVELRAAVVAADRRLAADPGWDQRHPRALLARTSLEVAVHAQPGALYALASYAIADLEAMSGDLPQALRPPLDRLRRAVAAATPFPES